MSHEESQREPTIGDALRGRVALVTGAGRGIGRGIAHALARAGCRVAVNYKTEPDLAHETVAELHALGVEAFAVEADVSVASQVREMVNQVIGRFGALDVAVNNAGVQTWKPFLEVTEEEWDLVMATNLKGCFLCTQAAARYMKDHGGGSIVNIGSGCNKVPFPELVAYTASKGGIEMLTKVAAVELGPHGIRVNCVAPGAIEVERTRLENPDYAGTWGRVTPLGRVGLPADVARAVVFLAGPDASFISGQTVWVDGALFTRPPWAYEPR
jgi:NAD(P)-dependent dehydrogenase (short-subunit alcohol dehydrogenase family)